MTVDCIDVREIPTLYINLDKDTDRKEHMEALLRDNGFKRFARLPGILAAPTAIDGLSGCTFSHCSAAKRLYKICNDKWCLVLEDDIQFKNIELINTAINEIINKHPEIECITITNHPTDTNGKGIYYPIIPGTRGMHFVLYRRDSLLKIANGLFNKWLHGNFNDIWEIDQTLGIKSAAFYSDACEQLKQSFVSQNEHHAHMSIYISKEPLDGKKFYSICFKDDTHDRFKDTSIHKVYHIDNTDLTELFGDNTVKPIQLPEQLTALVKSENIMDQYKALIVYNHVIYPQFNVFRIWNHEMNAWNAVSLK